MKLENKSSRKLQHSAFIKKDGKQVFEIIELAPGAHKEVPKEIAETWLKYKGVVEYVDPAEAKKAEAEAAEKQAKLEDENSKLKAELEKLKAEAKKAEANKSKK